MNHGHSCSVNTEMNNEPIYSLFLTILMLAGLPGAISAQDLSVHRWEERVLLVYTADSTSDTYNRQINDWLKDREGLKERRLILYSYTPTHYKKGWEETGWEKQESIPDQLFRTEGNFEVVLLGLDGGVKLRQDRFVTREALFQLIDAMPMRQRELNN